MKKYIFALGLDVGNKRIGVAGCDGLGLLATGLTTIKRTYFQKDLQQIQALIKERNAEILVVGLPYSMDGTVGVQAKQVQNFAQRIGKILNIPIEYVDERLTSVEAEEQLKAQKRFSTYNKGLVDQQAAAIILQQWLDQRS
jgi:putative holliday junction resolvase